MFHDLVSSFQKSRHFWAPLPCVASRALVVDGIRQSAGPYGHLFPSPLIHDTDCVSIEGPPGLLNGRRPTPSGRQPLRRSSFDTATWLSAMRRCSSAAFSRKPESICRRRVGRSHRVHKITPARYRGLTVRARIAFHGANGGQRRVSRAIQEARGGARECIAAAIGGRDRIA